MPGETPWRISGKFHGKNREGISIQIYESVTKGIPGKISQGIPDGILG